MTHDFGAMYLEAVRDASSQMRRLEYKSPELTFWLHRLEDDCSHLLDILYPLRPFPRLNQPKGGDSPMNDAEISAYLAHTRSNNSRLLAAMDLQHPMRGQFETLGTNLIITEDAWAQYLHTTTPH